ncbi:MAG TPA: plasmid pRiA4b ORF-3 family protein, partial [Nocardioides sp.]|nr:plasmid pRiA4b ORF-3 family protein [Nocardioides sp.]
HDVIQAAMGWSNSHLHSFVIGDALFGAPDEDADPEQLDEGSVSVVEALYGHERFQYEYDFGDCWEHDVCVEFFRRSPLKLAVCLGGENACPPEDCGGPHGYATMLEALADPSHEDHKEFVEWIHEFEPTAFDLVDANVALQRLR